MSNVIGLRRHVLKDVTVKEMRTALNAWRDADRRPSEMVRSLYQRIEELIDEVERMRRLKHDRP
jgi:hypothetical protein